ncbi:MAG: magnesium transporter CorA family protein [Anaerolineae bacterium]
MITIYKTGECGLEVLPEVTKGCWVNVIDPSPNEITWLQELGLPQEFILYPLDVDERARVEREDGNILIVVRLPAAEAPTADVPFTTHAVGIILTGQYLVTISKRDNEILRELAQGRVRDLSTAKRNRFILRLLLYTATKYLSYLREINRTVEALEDQLQMSTRNRELMALLKYQKSLVYFTTALKSNELMMERLQRSQHFAAYPDDTDLLEDVLTENQQAIEMTNIASNILSSMMDAFASIISNNLNTVMKFLAAMTIVLTLPVLVASLYGMNVDLPLQEWPYAFEVIILVSVGLAAIVARIFIKRDWM